METSKQLKGHNGHKKHFHSSAPEQVKETAEGVFDEGISMARSLYNQGLDTLEEAQTVVKDYSHTLWTNAHKHPLAASVIVGGVLGGLSVLLYALLKHK